MPARRRRAPAGRRGQRRKLVWALSDVSTAVAAGGLANIDLLAPLEVAGASKLGSTVMRIRGSIAVTWASTTDLSTMGLVVVRATDLGPGLGPNPSLAADREVDWMWIYRFWSDTSGGADPIQKPFEIDVRSKRRVEEMDQTLALQMANGNAATQTFKVFLRVLIALP